MENAPPQQASGQMPGQMPTRQPEPEQEENKTASEVRFLDLRQYS